MSTFTIFLILIIIVCFLLMLVIMVQNPKGGGLASSFGGGGGGGQIVGGVKKTGDFLDKSTWTLGIMLVVLILASNVALKGNFGGQDSKLLNGDGIEEVVPETVPETLPETLPEPVSVEPVGDSE
jgi:preprotein translocase subunit SecG